MRLSSLSPELIATVALLVSAPSAAASNNGLAIKSKDANTLSSVSGMSASDYAQCVSELASSRVVFEQAGDVAQQGCQLKGAIKLTAVATAFGDVGIAGKPAMLCSFARQFSAWVREVGAPLTLGYTGQRLAQIETGSAFACRARYDLPGAVPSEHAKGNAVDVAAFVLADSRRIQVKQQDSDMSRDLVRALRTTSCAYFTTVLGPGTDAAHADHLHFDAGMHGATPNYRICE